jgi:hypothetical protein
MAYLDECFIRNYDCGESFTQTDMKCIIENLAKAGASDFRIIDKGRSKIDDSLADCYCIVSIKDRLFKFTWYEKIKPAIDVIFDPIEVGRDILQPNGYYQVKPPKRMISPGGFIRTFDNKGKFLDVELMDIVHGGNGFKIVGTEKTRARDGSCDIITVIFSVDSRFFRVCWEQFIDTDGQVINNFDDVQPVEVKQVTVTKVTYKEK